jgi:outer membrane protein assembly factor BamB
MFIMKTKVLLSITAMLLNFAMASGQASGWNNGGGNSQRNGYKDVAGPTTDSILWQVTSPGAFGTPAFIEGDYLVTMRFLTGNYAPVECYSLTTGDLVWSSDVTNSSGRSLPVGLQDGRVYVVGYTDTFRDTLYALNVTDGSRLWKFSKTVGLYITETVVFDALGNLYVYGNQKTYKINPETGQMIWQTNTVPMASGSGETAINNDNDTGYILEQSGGVSYLWAINLTTGQKKYTHKVPDLQPGGNVPQSALMIGPGGTIYTQLTEDNVAAFSDDGTKLTLLWQTPITGNAAFSLMCVGADNSVYAPSGGKIIRLDPATGNILNTSATITQGGFYSPRISATSNNMIYATNGENYVYAFNQNLELMWSGYLQGTNTSGVCISENGLAVVSGKNTIRVYTPSNAVSTNDLTATGVRLHPNPATSFCVLSADNADAGIQYILFDLSGKVVRTGITQEKHTVLDLSGVPPGTYFMKTGGTAEPVKLIRQ